MLSRDLKFPDGKGFYPDVQNGERGYNTDPARGADTFFPFKSAGYSIPSAMSIGGQYNSGDSVVRLPLKDVKKISFNWSKTYYCSAYINLEKEGVESTSILTDTSRGDKNSSITKELNDEKYAFIIFRASVNGQAWGSLTISNFVAS